MWLGLSLFYVGAVLFLNGLWMLGKIADKEIWVINIFTGVVSLCIGLASIFGPAADAASVKSGALTLLFAFIPGAGQMYQGYMKRGLSLVLMAAAISMAAMLIPPIAFALLVVFMYSFFDTFNLRAQISMGTAPEDDYLVHFDPQDKRLARMMMDSHKLVGWCLIAIGALIAYKQIIMNTLGDILWRWGQKAPVWRAIYLVMDQLPEVEIGRAHV